MIDTHIFHIIVNKFSYEKELDSIVFFIIDKSSEIGLNHTVFPLDLAINLRVESSKELLLDPKNVA